MCVRLMTSTCLHATYIYMCTLYVIYIYIYMYIHNVPGSFPASASYLEATRGSKMESRVPILIAIIDDSIDI